MIGRAACDPAVDFSVLDIPMTPETRRRLRREAEDFITIALLAPDHFAAALAIMSDEVVEAVANALCRTVLTTPEFVTCERCSAPRRCTGGLLHRRRGRPWSSGLEGVAGGRVPRA